MSLLSRFKRQRVKNYHIDDPNWLSEWQTLADFLGVSLDPSDVDVRGKRALKEITVYVCIKILSENISKLPVKIYQDNGGIKKVAGHYLNPILRLRPNPYMSASDFWKGVEVQRNIYGNSYVWIEYANRGRNAGKVQALYLLDAQQMQVWVDDSGLISSKNSIWYVYTDNAGVQYKLQSTDLLHFKAMTTDGIVGLSPIYTLRNMVENAASAEKFLNNSYKNGMQTTGIIHYTGDLNENAKKKFREKFEEMSSGLKNANRVSLMPIGYTYQPLSLKLTDAQFLENTQLTYRQIASAFGIKAHQLNDLVKASYASTSEANREFYVDTLMPILTMYEQELTYKLFLDSELVNGFYVMFNADAILRGDFKSRIDAAATGVQNGLLTPNEARALEEREPMPGGDQLVMNGNYIPLSMVGEQYKKGGDNTNGQT
ncbi:phage portal protein [Weizmannia coagulans]|uniref:Phage portal protein, HK97 family n=2 Tax=Heyndrickxia TaxID=2837504 RepID=A0AAN0T6Q8_HEYCO|nr:MULTISPECIES: phage portal protein [Heyndrickxia]NWN93795.1 phage portal protein [Bacillus sp. (in: firmicutes)]AJO22879.1 phage portal protein, HK97 family [Heyndrickxia coagulans]AKN55610.1 Phage portal protein [Heyndrickxia coagulans]ATW83118.1 phage portal protein [Heyndrickxia coagulans]KGB28325.1 nucleoid-structuring protein H-NS [Heyndrickxia coagulans]